MAVFIRPIRISRFRSSALPMATGVSKTSRTRWRREATLPGSVHAYSAAAPTITAASRCASPITISSPTRPMVLATIGRSRYDDVVPYYEKAERFIGVSGTKEGIRSAPDGIFQPPAAPRVHEVLVQRAGKRLGIPVIPGRLAIITKPTNGRAAMPLLRAVRTWMHDCVELFFQSGPDLPGDENRQAQDLPERDGARADHGRSGQSESRFLRR